MPTRRAFLHQAGLASTGLMIGTNGLLGNDGLFMKKKTIGLQLYTVRKEIYKDPEGVIAKVAGIGYNSVEAFGYGEGKYFGLTPVQLSDLLKKYHLKSPSGHYMMMNYFMKDDQNDLKDNIAAAVTLGHKYLVIPFLTDNMRTSLDDYKRLAVKFNEAAKVAKDSGLKLAYHNHDFEFKDWGGGQTGFDVFLKETDPSLVFFEMDMYWVTRAGLDPVQLINANPGRIKMWHIKDMSQKMPPSYTVEGQQYFAEAGAGIIDFKTIFTYKKKSGMEYFFVEQDETSEPVYDAITKSYGYVKANLAR
jgi:sugar phosphate isomerase/epimerase